MHIIVPVWGKAYTRSLVDIALPALLAPGNLPGLGDCSHHLCHIITTSADRRTIEDTTVYGLLKNQISVRFHEIDRTPAISDDRHHWQSYCNRVGIKAADECGAAMIFLNPDVVIADGGIKALMALLHRGKRAIQVLGIRLVKESVAPLLINNYSSEQGARLCVSARELIRIAVANLHPLTRLHLYNESELDISPSALYWMAGSEGLLARCFHLHPMLVYPRIRNAPFTSTIDDDYLRAACPDPEDEYIVADSDEFCACELSSIQRPAVSLPRSSVIDEDVALWAASAARSQHFENLARRIILHSGGTEGKAWAAACAESDQAINRILNRVLELKLGA